MKFANQVAIVTGAGRGIGRAIAMRFASEGARVAVVSRTEKNSEQVAEEINAKFAGLAKGYAVDVADHAAVQALCEKIDADFSRVDILVNNAGITRDGLSMRMSPEDWDVVLETNLKGAFNFYQGVARGMMKQRSGRIINIASVAGFCAGPQMSAYNASKAAVIALSETLMQEYGAYGVRTMVVMPAFFRTSIIDNGRGPARVLDAARKLIDKSNLEAPEVAEAILMAASRGRTHLVYPPKYRGLWWLKRFMPQRWHQIFPRLTRR